MWFSEIKSKAALAMACTLAAATVSQARSMSGEGRNGPDLSGESIPLSVDRLVQIPQIDKAVSYCFNEYVGNYLLSQLQRTPFRLGMNLTQTKNMSSNGYRHLNGDPDPSAMATVPVSDLSILGNTLPVKVNNSDFLLSSFDARSFSTVMMKRLSEGNYVLAEVTRVVVGFQLKSAAGETRAVSLQAEGFPVLIYRWTKDLSKPDDELGTIKPVVRASGIRFAGTATDTLKFVNRDSNVETSLEVSPKQYKDCVIAELSK